jgi:CobQ-like glutamine amidotransferase family enzyme
MNIYGDHGNLLMLQRRAELYGFATEYAPHEPGQAFPTDADIILGGGGQDSGQDKIQADLLKNGANLRDLAKSGTPMLLICGLYQLFGHYFATHAGHKIEGIGLFELYTQAGAQRLIGNIITETEFGRVVGYENHSGLTHLADGQVNFGQVIQGAGNNGADGGEGARIFNVIGSYLHGPILPKNPGVADFLIQQAAARKFGDAKLSPRDDIAANELNQLDEIAERARAVAMTRPR